MNIVTRKLIDIGCRLFQMMILVCPEKILTDIIGLKSAEITFPQQQHIGDGLFTNS
jgi:hypothetical protein